ncbi:MAG: glycoside hydrolase family 127 protein, partial [Novibacillus thermophilus]
AELVAQFEDQLLNGVCVITGWGIRTSLKSISSSDLYRTTEMEKVPVEIKAVPYYTWSNRSPGEMIVWIRES